jgi:fatty-acyl-CoA synthase
MEQDQSMRTISELLSHAAATAGDTLIRCSDGDLSYRELDQEVWRVASGLRNLGIGPGDRVGLWLPNLRAYLCLYGACARLGAIGVGMNTRYRRTEIEDVLRRSRPKVLAFVPSLGRADHMEILNDVDPALLAGLSGVVQVGGEPVLAGGLRVTQYAELAAAESMDGDLGGPDSGCVIFMTSGTTSLPKFVLHNQEQVVRHACDVARVLQLCNPGTMVLQSLPFCGVFGFIYLLATLRAGAPTVIPVMFEASEAAALMLRHTVTHVAGGDDMFSRLLTEGDRLTGGAEKPYPALRFCPYVGFNSALAEFYITAYQRGLPLLSPFGMSEVFSFFSLRRKGDLEEIRTLGGGVPVYGEAKVRVRDLDSGEVLGDDREGELEIWTPNLFVGYYGNAEATAKAMTEDGYFKTGDLGTTQADGAFTYLGRMGDVLRLGGFLVNPLEIETHLCAYHTVADAQTVAIATDRGNRPVAFVIPEAGAVINEAALIDHCRQSLAGFKVPVRVISIDAFPSTASPNGTKIQKAELRRLAEQSATV